MKVSQIKIMLGWLIGIGIVGIALLVVLLVNQVSIKKQLKSLNTSGYQTSSGSDASQLSSIQSSINTLSNKVDAIPISTVKPSTTLTCTGTLSQDLSGLAIPEGDDTGYSLNGSSPIDLTCDPL